MTLMRYFTLCLDSWCTHNLVFRQSLLQLNIQLQPLARTFLWLGQMQLQLSAAWRRQLWNATSLQFS
jgi:hypothetical protein